MTNPSALVAHHIAASLLALIEWWIEHDIAYPPERMAQIYDHLIVKPTHARSLN